MPFGVWHASTSVLNRILKATGSQFRKYFISSHNKPLPLMTNNVQISLMILPQHVREFSSRGGTNCILTEHISYHSWIWTNLRWSYSWLQISRQTDASMGRNHHINFSSCSRKLVKCFELFRTRSIKSECLVCTSFGEVLSSCCRIYQILAHVWFWYKLVLVF